MKDERSKYYKLGHEIGFSTALVLIRSITRDKSLVEKLIYHYNEYPLIKKIEMNQLDVIMNELGITNV